MHDIVTDARQTENIESQDERAQVAGLKATRRRYGKSEVDAGLEWAHDWNGHRFGRIESNRA